MVITQNILAAANRFTRVPASQSIGVLRTARCCPTRRKRPVSSWRESRWAVPLAAGPSSRCLLQSAFPAKEQLDQFTAFAVEDSSREREAMIELWCFERTDS